MTRSHSDLLWPVERLPDALEQLAQRQGYGRAAGEIAPPAASVEPSRVWMFALGDRLGVELEPITPLYHELPDVLERAAPCILQVRRDGVPSYLVLLGTRRGKLRLLARDATAVSVPTKSALAPSEMASSSKRLIDSRTEMPCIEMPSVGTIASTWPSSSSVRYHKVSPPKVRST